MAYDYQNAIRQLQEAHRLLAGGLFGRIAQELQRKRDIRARNIPGRITRRSHCSASSEGPSASSRQALKKVILRLDRTDALMSLSDAIDFLSNEHTSSLEPPSMRMWRGSRMHSRHRR